MSELSQAPVCEKHGCEKVWHKNRARKSGGQWACKKCRQEIGRRYDQANREKRNEAKREYRKRTNYLTDRLYREANREHLNACKRRWIKANPERARATQQRYHAKNPGLQTIWKAEWRRDPANAEKSRKASRDWANKNPEYVTANRWRRKARVRNAMVPGRLVTAEIQEQRKYLFMGCCYCKALVPLSLEHVVALEAGGLHVEENLLGACQKCNSSKNTSPVEAWYRAQPFFSEERWLEILQVTSGKEPDEDAVGASAA